MNRLYILLFFALVSKTTWACGDYLISALVKAQKEDFVFLINPGTVSEIRLLYAQENSQKLAAYENRFIETKIKITSPLDKTRGEVESFGEIKVLVPDPLINNQNTRMSLLKKTECKK